MKLPFFQTTKAEEDALLQAMDLRARYGEDAEQWCEEGILAAEQLSRRRTLYRIRDALRTIPSEDAIAY